MSDDDAALVARSEGYAELIRDLGGARLDVMLAQDFSNHIQSLAAALSRAPALVASLVAEVERLREAKDNAYAERNRLVAALSKVFPAWLERHPDADVSWEDDWRWIVFVALPTGQASWHIHDSELAMFSHLERRAGNSWDGHTTEQKYERVASLEPRHD